MRNYINLIRCAVILAVIGMLSMNVKAQVANNDSIRRPRVGVVLCGGGAKGFAHIGVLRKIEEAGIPIDYISGTSIGSIIGGLYAAGYDPDMMEKLVREQDWNTIIYDRIPDRIKPIEKKMENTKYIVTLPIKKGKVKVGESLVDGVYVNNLLSRLMLPAKGIDDFKKLSVPFYCMGTDIEKACEYEMDKGCLSRSIRASMAIPFFFTPVRYDGRLLIDGGMINNFPVRNMEEKDVDIIIGIDLEDYNIAADDIDNSLSLLTNVMNLSSLEQTEYGRKHCDIYIRPNLHGRNMMSFNDFDSILYYGEQAAEDMFPKLKRLGDSIHAISDFEVVRPHAQPIDSLYVVDIRFNGLRDNNDPYVKREFSKTFPRMFSVDEIEETILRLKASGFYSDLWYEVSDAPGGVVLTLHCKEVNNQSFSFDIHYDNNYGIGALVNYTLTSKGNKFKRGALSVDLNVAECPYLRVRVNKRDGKFFRYGTELFGGYYQIDQYNEGKINHTYSIQNDRMELFGQLTHSYFSSLKLGVAGEFFHVNDLVGNMGLSKNYEFYSYLYANYYLNTEDITTFAKRGWKINATVKCIFYDGVFSNSSSTPAWSFQADAMKTSPVAEKHSIKFGGSVNARLGTTELPIPYKYFIGGQSKMKYADNIKAFDGLDFIEKVVDFASFARVAWQWNVYKQFYTIVSTNFGHMNSDFRQWFKKDSFVMGAGLTLGINTFAGPVEVSLMTSNINEFVGFINVGYWF